MEGRRVSAGPLIAVVDDDQSLRRAVVSLVRSAGYAARGFASAEDYLGLLGDDDDGFVYPLKEAAEQDYRYTTGDTTRITLQSGKVIRVLELKVSPRRADWRLMSGSLWFDDETVSVQHGQDAMITG